MVQNLQKYHVPICAKKKFSLCLTQNKLQPKNINLDPFLVNFLENSPTSNCVKKHCRLILTVKLIPLI